MVGVRDKTCARAECSRYPSYGLKGSNKREFCSQHAEPGMVNVYHRTCIHEGCLKRPSFGIKGTKRKDYCEAHSESGMVNLNIRCSRQGCNRMARYGADEKLCYRHVRNMASRRAPSGAPAAPSAPAAAPASTGTVSLAASTAEEAKATIAVGDRNNDSRSCPASNSSSGNKRKKYARDTEIHLSQRMATAATLTATATTTTTVYASGRVPPLASPTPPIKQEGMILMPLPSGVRARLPPPTPAVSKAAWPAPSDPTKNILEMMKTIAASSPEAIVAKAPPGVISALMSTIASAAALVVATAGEPVTVGGSSSSSSNSRAVSKSLTAPKLEAAAPASHSLATATGRYDDVRQVATATGGLANYRLGDVGRMTAGGAGWHHGSAKTTNNSRKTINNAWANKSSWEVKQEATRTMTSRSDDAPASSYYPTASSTAAYKTSTSTTTTNDWVKKELQRREGYSYYEEFKNVQQQQQQQQQQQTRPGAHNNFFGP